MQTRRKKISRILKGVLVRRLGARDEDALALAINHNHSQVRLTTLVLENGRKYATNPSFVSQHSSN